MSTFIPEHYRYAAIPHIMIDGAADAIEFYAAAFDAEELLRIPRPDGKILHAELRIGASVVMMGDVERPFVAPNVAGGTTVGLHVYVEDVDALHERAVAAGATSMQPPTNMFHGDRTIVLRDPYGHMWIFLTHMHDVPIDDLVVRGEAQL
ncbi:VOC family protein [Paractinoplanes hotanensis]|uniref:VOC family protein n=1 Tax=Paractinoplanes hotanensis TaxID=2906497 RepID=A0ABT0XWS3_9ACTN|nr:VOC family protein [Actinoplanes hotanensis]MCM4078248.1 VOC family protein [Actinoplanes hotanensis]